MAKYWLRCEDSLSPPYFLDNTTSSYYLHEYVSKGSYKQYPENSLIMNLKMDVEEIKKERWHYKQEAIKIFANAIIQKINLPIPNAIFIPMPTSKPRKHPKFDSRLDDVIGIINRQTGQFTGFNLDLIKEEVPYHASGEYRDPDQILININFTPFQEPVPEKVILIDDVITTGAHFTACSRKIKSIYPYANIVGLFLAKTIWQP